MGATNTPEAAALARYVNGSSYDETRHRVDVALWICRRRRPYAIIEDPELLAIFANLHAPTKNPSASTVSRDVKEIFGYSREHVVEVLVKVDGKVHLTADGWTSPNTIAYLGVTVQYVTKSGIMTYPLDFIKYVYLLYTCSHTCNRRS